MGGFSERDRRDKDELFQARFGEGPLAGKTGDPFIDDKFFNPWAPGGDFNKQVAPQCSPIAPGGFDDYESTPNPYEGCEIIEPKIKAGGSSPRGLVEDDKQLIDKKLAHFKNLNSHPLSCGGEVGEFFSHLRNSTLTAINSVFSPDNIIPIERINDLKDCDNLHGMIIEVDSYRENSCQTLPSLSARREGRWSNTLREFTFERRILCCVFPEGISKEVGRLFSQESTEVTSLLHRCVSKGDGDEVVRIKYKDGRIEEADRNSFRGYALEERCAVSSPMPIDRLIRARESISDGVLLLNLLDLPKTIGVRSGLEWRLERLAEIAGQSHQLRFCYTINDTREDRYNSCTKVTADDLRSRLHHLSKVRRKNSAYITNHSQEDFSLLSKH